MFYVYIALAAAAAARRDTIEAEEVKYIKFIQTHIYMYLNVCM